MLLSLLDLCCYVMVRANVCVEHFLPSVWPSPMVLDVVVTSYECAVLCYIASRCAVMEVLSFPSSHSVLCSLFSRGRFVI
jgi:hypothetical protein